MAKIPPMEVPILGQRQQPVPRTFTDIHFQSCQVGFNVTGWDGEGNPSSYVLVILDPINNKKYNFAFGEALRLEMLNDLASLANKEMPEDGSPS